MTATLQIVWFYGFELTRVYCTCKQVQQQAHNTQLRVEWQQCCITQTRLAMSTLQTQQRTWRLEGTQAQCLSRYVFSTSHPLLCSHCKIVFMHNQLDQTVALLSKVRARWFVLEVATEHWRPAALVVLGLMLHACGIAADLAGTSAAVATKWNRITDCGQRRTEKLQSC